MDNNQNNDEQKEKQSPQKIYSSYLIAPGIIDPRHLVIPANPKSGDLFYSDGTKFVKLNAGTNGQTLVNSNGVPLWSNTVTGTTGSFSTLQITPNGITGATGTTASLGPAGALAGGPATATQKGWAVVYIAGVKSYFPIWS